jgi:membrane protein YdbS with pleckstrin-like domain
MLVAPLAIFLGSVSGLRGSSLNKLVSVLLVLIASVSYATLLYPFKYKPYFLNNSFPALLLILVVVTLFYFLQGWHSTDAQSIDKQVAA